MTSIFSMQLVSRPMRQRSNSCVQTLFWNVRMLQCSAWTVACLLSRFNLITRTKVEYVAARCVRRAQTGGLERITRAQTLSSAFHWRHAESNHPFVCPPAHVSVYQQTHPSIIHLCLRYHLLRYHLPLVHISMPLLNHPHMKNTDPKRAI